MLLKLKLVFHADGTNCHGLVFSLVLFLKIAAECYICVRAAPRVSEKMHTMPVF